MAETSTIFGFMKYVSATDILSDFKKTVDSHFVNSLTGFQKPAFFYKQLRVLDAAIANVLPLCNKLVVFGLIKPKAPSPIKLELKATIKR